jgi:membrane protease YdiL (CAAX protease family)
MLILVGFGLSALIVLWAVQALALVVAGKNSVWVLPFRYGDDSELVRWALKAALQSVLLAIIFVYPLAIGKDPIAYHLSWLGVPHWSAVIRVAALTVLVFAVQHVIVISTGMVRLSGRYSFKRTVHKVARSFLIPVPLAFVEETVFRGILLRQLLEFLPAATWGIALAVVLSSVLFASVHFLRPQKRTVLPALGLFGLGLMLGVAYVISGQSCWLPVAIHAGGVWVIQVMRPFVTYRGPVILTGYSSYPMCGVLGLTAMLVLTALVMVTAGT